MPKKKKHSDKINKIIPTLKPRVDSELCAPSYVLSRLISRPHKNEETKKSKIEKRKGTQYWERTIITTPKPNPRNTKEVKKGQGLKETKWKGLNFFI